MIREPLHLATGTNRAYLHWCATTILSAVRATQDHDVTVHLLIDSDVTEEDCLRLRAMTEGAGARLSFLPVDHQRLSDLPDAVRHHGGAVSCARFLLAEELPAVDRLVYLDADTLAVDSLGELATTGLGGAALGAVRNVVEPRMRWHLDELGFGRDEPYLNSGVLVMDLAVMRRDAAADQLLDTVRRRAGELLWVDQDALNLVFRDGWKQLHPRWNAQNSMWRWPEVAAQVVGAERLREATQTPAVLHFEGPSLAKPWHFLCSHPYRDAYLAAARETPWGEVRLQDRTAATRLLAVAPARWRVPLYVRLLQSRERLRPKR